MHRRAFWGHDLLTQSHMMLLNVCLTLVCLELRELYVCETCSFAISFFKQTGTSYGQSSKKSFRENPWKLEFPLNSHKLPWFHPHEIHHNPWKSPARRPEKSRTIPGWNLTLSLATAELGPEASFLPVPGGWLGDIYVGEFVGEFIFIWW